MKGCRGLLSHRNGTSSERCHLGMARRSPLETDEKLWEMEEMVAKALTGKVL